MCVGARRTAELVRKMIYIYDHIYVLDDREREEGIWHRLPHTELLGIRGEVSEYAYMLFSCQHPQATLRSGR